MKQKVTMERRSFVKCVKRAKNPTFLQTCGKSTKNPNKDDLVIHEASKDHRYEV